MAKTRTKTKPDATAPAAKGYVHSSTEAVARPAVGAAPRLKTKKPPTTYRYDSSLFPAMDWDTNPSREVAAFLMSCIKDAAALPTPHVFSEPRRLIGADKGVLVEVTGLRDAVDRLRRLQAPLLNWSGKAERMSFDVPTCRSSSMSACPRLLSLRR
jgi:adenine-specific DNA-methyltransferase